MNKLMRIEWVSEWVSEWVIECHSSTTKSPWHDYVIHELKSRTDTWRGSSKGRSLILKKTKYPKLPCIFHYYSWLPITRTLANSNQSRFDLHIYWFWVLIFDCNWLLQSKFWGETAWHQNLHWNRPSPSDRVTLAFPPFVLFCCSIFRTILYSLHATACNRKSKRRNIWFRFQ